MWNITVENNEVEINLSVEDQAAATAILEAIKAEESATASAESAGIATGAATQAIQAKEYLESELFHYITDDEISVKVGIGTQVLVTESTEGYDSIILELSTT